MDLGHGKVIDILIKSRADLNAVDFNGHTPSDYSSWIGMRLFEIEQCQLQMQTNLFKFVGNWKERKLCIKALDENLKKVDENGRIVDDDTALIRAIVGVEEGKCLLLVATS